ncbi:secretion protein snm4 [Catenulispora acidiphila DSM 44928]|uniref:Secretion protein snm4 n=1 Tax=Catenulispora acidiphila (strain DSM 44928 / JCM 14897 / NBRC 102108 / NRRL B-24433 / ID139908) TaxID=479433 RepID=C7PYM2_CATAD|nr:type VII secretion integral membrane protein EccD [Catenulispora acidiphila]ACU77344.1 secretion protein snm4 [Catenulispora acidiphila DSM 44928]
METSPALSFSETCRITVVAPRMRLDIAVPADVPLAALVPTLLLHTGEQAIEAGAAHGGWALQRLGEPPLDTNGTCAALGILDGDIVYFRPRAVAAPEAVFDDPVDGIGTILRDRTRRWTPTATRRCALICTALLPQVVLYPLLRSGPSWTGPALTAGIVALALLLTAAALSRAVGDSVAGAFIGVAAVPFAAVAGLLAPLGDDALGSVGAAHLATAGAAAFAASILGAWFVGVGAGPGTGVGVGTAAGPGTQPDKPPAGAALLAPAMAAAAVALAALASLRWNPEGCAALAAALMLALSVLIPRIAYRAAGLPPTLVPLNATDLRTQSAPLSTASLTGRSVTADRLVTALVAGSALAVAACTAFALRWPGWTPPVLAAVITVLLALRARLFGGAAQRWWLIGAALAVAVPTATAVADRWRGGSVGLGVVVGVVLLATAIVGQIAVRPERRFAPTLARWADLLELTAVMATVPLALLMLGTFGYFRSLGG